MSDPEWSKAVFLIPEVELPALAALRPPPLQKEFKERDTMLRWVDFFSDAYPMAIPKFQTKFQIMIIRSSTTCSELLIHDFIPATGSCVAMVKLIQLPLSVGIKVRRLLHGDLNMQNVDSAIGSDLANSSRTHEQLKRTCRYVDHS